MTVRMLHGQNTGKILGRSTSQKAFIYMLSLTSAIMQLETHCVCLIDHEQYNEPGMSKGMQHGSKGKPAASLFLFDIPQ